MRIMKDGQNQMLKDGALSETARKAIAGMMKLASSITAFGNTNLLPIFVWFLIRKHRPTFAGATATVRYWYAFRLAGRQNGYVHVGKSVGDPSHYDTTQKQTVEMRSPDGSADLYQLIAGLAVACRYGFEIDDALGIAEKHMSM